MTHPTTPPFDLAQYEAEACYAAGWNDALTAIAARTIALHAAWAPIGRATRAQRIQAELAHMAQLSDQVSQELGRPAGYTYRGGPVNWHTGKPLTTAWQADIRAVAA